MSPNYRTNQEIAEVLERVSALLEAQDANPYRINAYRKAARLVERFDRSIAEIAVAAEGEKLEDLPDIGKSIGGAIREFVHTGRLALLERLEGELSPEDLFKTVPGIGEELAKRIYSELHVETLEDLELAAHDGRLEGVPGMGHRRVMAVRDSLEAVLSRSGRRRARRLRHLNGAEAHGEPERPSVALLLEVDEEYRNKAERGKLRTISPRRFNPDGKYRLPVLHTDRDGWHFNVLFSNTARAHELGKNTDWVVIYYERDGLENQHTVVTETHGALKGRRVVRGREKECLGHYARLESRTGSEVGSPEEFVAS
ncbi:MAG: helix-hairpin-helix domain-containing protein [Deltaproteobacteria bacterium]